MQHSLIINKNKKNKKHQAAKNKELDSGTDEAKHMNYLNSFFNFLCNHNGTLNPPITSLFTMFCLFKFNE